MAMLKLREYQENAIDFVYETNRTLILAAVGGICPLCGAIEDTNVSFAGDVGKRRIYWNGGLGPYETKKSRETNGL